jgi:hypothetical protein
MKADLINQENNNIEELDALSGNIMKPKQSQHNNPVYLGFKYCA